MIKLLVLVSALVPSALVSPGGDDPEPSTGFEVEADSGKLHGDWSVFASAVSELSAREVSGAATHQDVTQLVDQTVRMSADSNNWEFELAAAQFSTVPVIAENGLVVARMEGLTWSGRASDGTRITMVISDDGSGAWAPGAGFVDMPDGTSMVITSGPNGAELSPVDPIALRQVEWTDPITDSDEGKAITAAVEEQQRRATGAHVSGFRSPRTPVTTAPAPIDVLGVVATGLTYRQAFDHFLAGIDDFNQVNASSSSWNGSSGHLTANVFARLAGLLVTSHTRNADSVTDLNWLRLSNTAVNNARNAVSADVVSMVFPGSWANTCGRAEQPGAFSVTGAEYITGSQCAGRRVFAHEVGHNYGAGHDDCNATGSCWQTWARGANVAGHTVMHTTTGRIQRWSNPDIGTGTSDRNNARAIEASAATMSTRRVVPATTLSGEFRSITPTRVFNSRSNPYGYPYTLSANTTYQIPLIDYASGTIPANAAGVFINITLVAPSANGTINVRPYPESASSGYSVGRFTAGSNRAISTVVPISEVGVGPIINLRMTTNASVIIDVLGYFGDDGTHAFNVVNATNNRALDDNYSAGATAVATVGGSYGVPTYASGTRAVLVNLTTVGTGDGHLEPVSGGSSYLNYQAGAASANMAVLPMGSDNKVRVRPQISGARVIVDVLGYFTTGSGLAYFRDGARGIASTNTINSGQDKRVVAGGAGCAAAILNLEGYNATQVTHMIAHKDGTSLPTGSTVNVTPTWGNSNHTVVKPVNIAGVGRVIEVYNLTGTITARVNQVGCFG